MTEDPHLEYFVWRTPVVVPRKVLELPDEIWVLLRSYGLIQMRPRHG